MPVKQEIIDLYDSFTHGGMSRRAFLDRLAALAGGTAAATLLLPLLKNDYALAQKVAEDDPSITTETVPIIDAVGTIHGYLAVPQSVESVPGAVAGLSQAPAVLVIHENRGLNPHIKDVARRFAKEGFVALAVDLLSLDGGTPDDEDEAREMIGALDPDVALDAAMAAVAYLKTHPNTTGPVGVVGFCWGGGLANRLAASDASVQAVVSYYGRQLPADEVADISAPLLLHYAGLDERINAGIEDFRAALEASRKDYAIHLYEGVNHAFNNDTGGRYDADAADLAWDRTIEFFKQHLGDGS